MHTILIAADSIGRVDVHTLPQETLMELLVENFAHTMPIIASARDHQYIPVRSWNGVHFAPNGNIATIDWSFSQYGHFLTCAFDKGGSIDFQFIPQSVLDFRINNMELHGTVDTSCLPPRLKRFAVRTNQLKGAFSLKGLPETIESLNISSNRMEGSLDLENCPQKAIYLRAKDNNFSGTLDFSNVSVSLKELDLSMNKFYGPIDVSNIAHALQFFWLEKNEFRDEVITLGDALPSYTLSADLGAFTQITQEGDTCTYEWNASWARPNVMILRPKKIMIFDMP